MQDNSIYIAEIYVGECKISEPLSKRINLVFRIGKNVVQNISERPYQHGIVPFNATLYLNINKTALEMQRSSLTVQSITQNQTTMLGIALINLPKESNSFHKKYRLTNSPDKNAEIDIMINIKPYINFDNDIRRSNFSEKPMPISQQPKKMKPQTKKNHSTTTPPLQISPIVPKQIKMMDSLKNPEKEYEQLVPKLQKECECLKQLLKIQKEKNMQSEVIIKYLKEQLQKNEDKRASTTDQFQESLLLEESFTQTEDQEQYRRNWLLKHHITELQIKVEELTVKLNNKEQQMSSKLYQQGSINDSPSKVKDLITKIDQLEHLNRENKVNYEKLKEEIERLQLCLFNSDNQFQKIKKKFKIDKKYASLKLNNVEKDKISLETVKKIALKLIFQRNQLLNIILKQMKEQNDKSLEGFLSKIKQKVQKSFASMAAKKLNKQILSSEKRQLIKCVQDLWIAYNQ